MAVDTLKLYERLRKATSQDETAKELAEIFKETSEEFLERLATKEDIDLKIEIVRKEIKELELTLRKEIAESKNSVIIWVTAIMLAQTAAVVGTLIKLLGK